MGKFKEIAIEIQETKKIIEQPFTSEIVAEDCNCDQTLQLIDRLKELEEKYGSINVNLEDGTFETVEKENE